MPGQSEILHDARLLQSLPRAIQASDSIALPETVKVCHISMCLQTGGLERLLVDLARFHDRHRFELEFIALSGDGQPAADIRAAGCAVTVLNEDLKIHKLRSLAQLAHRLRERRIQIAHTHNTYAQFYGTLAAKMAQVPVLINTQHGRGCGNGWKAEWQFRIANRMTQRIVGVSHDAARLCQSQDQRSKEKITTIWNGINLDRFAYRGPRLAPIAISVARLTPQKDFPTLLQAVQLVLPHVPDFRLWIVGDGSERSHLETLIDELNIGRHVELIGERHDVPDLLAKSGFFVSSSMTEGISLTLLEAMAVGIPVVATNVGGNSEVVIDGQTGKLVPPRDPAALARAIVDLCGERDLWIAIGLQGRHRVEQNFEIREMVRRYEALYDELLQARHQSEIRR